MVSRRAPQAPEKPTLGYWACRGQASQIRYELVYLGVDFQDEVYQQGPAPDFDRSQWLDKKDTLGLKFPSLPYFIDGQARLTDPGAIMKFIASKYAPDLLGKTATQQGQVEMVSTVINELKVAVTTPCYQQGDRVAISMTLLEKVKPLVNFLASKKFLVGSNVTYVDFIFFELCDFMNWIS